MSGVIDIVRVTVSYGRGAPEILSATLIQGPDPRETDLSPTGTSGIWLTVEDPAGRAVFARTLPDPGTAIEAAEPGGPIVQATQDEPRLVAVEVPWPGPGSTIEILDRRHGGPDLETPPSRLALVPTRPVMLEGAAPPIVVHPIWGHANARALTLLFLPDGFLEAEMDAFHATIDLCVQGLAATRPFSELKESLRIAHVDLPSRQSGIIGATARDTAFSGHFQANLDRVILADQRRAMKVLDRSVDGSGAAVIVANTGKYGGSGGAAPVFSRHADAAEIAIHELGHSAFGLADEYEAAGQSSTDEPVEPNVSRHGTRDKLKWAAMVPAGTRLPTLLAGEPLPVPPPAGIGAFEGAKYHSRERFRPQYDCKMRTLGQPFCAVCEGVIGRILSVRLPAAPHP